MSEKQKPEFKCGFDESHVLTPGTLECEECIRLGYQLRITPVRVGRQTRLVVHLPPEADR